MLGGLFRAWREAMSRGMDEQEHQGQGGQEQSAARIGYPAKSPGPPANAFRRALEALGARTIPQGTKLFLGRAQPWQVRDWRLGRRGAPAWAVDLLKRQLDAEIARLQALKQELQPGPGFDWRRNAASVLGRRRP